jgi:hypothetical protein
MVNNVYGYLMISPTNLNITRKTQLFDETSVVFGLFIGYLIVGATRHQVDLYVNLPVAYLCIQGRGIAAMLGTFCILLSKYITNSVDELYAEDISPDTQEREQLQRNAIYQFLEMLEMVQMFTYFISYACFSIFFFSFCLGLYSMYHQDLDFIFFGLFLTVSTIVLIVLIVFIFYHKRRTLNYIKTLRTPTPKPHELI